MPDSLRDSDSAVPSPALGVRRPGTDFLASLKRSSGARSSTGGARKRKPTVRC